MAIVRNKVTNVPYEYLGENKFRNLHTQKQGEVPEEKAKEIFNINLDATNICGQYPQVKELIGKLKLVMESN